MNRVLEVHGPRRPTAVGFLCADISGPDQIRHANDIRRLAEQTGYRLGYTVRLWKDAVSEPVEHVLGIAASSRAAAVVVPDLMHVDNRPGRVCEVCDLITVYPEQAWAATVPVFAQRRERILTPAGTCPDEL